MNEIKLIIKAKKQNRLAQSELYELYRHRWFALCLRYQKDREDAVDALQNGLIKVFKHLKVFDPKKGEFGAWSSRVIINENLMLLRSNKRSFQTTDIDEGEYEEATEENALDRLSAQEITDLISKLPHGYRTVFNLYAVDGYGHAEIAEMLNISEGTSKSQLYKARKLLQAKLEVLI